MRGSVTPFAPLGVRVVVLDTGPLLNDLVRRCRQDYRTGLTQAAGSLSTRAYAAVHVRAEVERNLTRVGAERGLKPERLGALWTTEYLPVISFVKVPPIDSVAAKEVGRRDPSDLPTAVLAQLIAADAVLAEDNDLIATGFAPSGWLDVSLALRDVAAFQSGLAATNLGLAVMASSAMATVAQATEHPRIAVLGGSLVLGIVGFAWLRGWYPSRSALQHAAGDLGRRLDSKFALQARAIAVLNRWTVPSGELDQDLVLVASAVARASRPLSPAAVASLTGVPRRRVHHALGSSAFRRSNGGWLLGEGSRD